MFMERLHIVKKLVLPNLVYRLPAFTIKISEHRVDIDKLVLRFMWSDRIPGIVSALLGKNQVTGLTQPDSKTWWTAI